MQHVASWTPLIPSPGFAIDKPSPSDIILLSELFCAAADLFGAL
jgi:hypothetical protein